MTLGLVLVGIAAGLVAALGAVLAGAGLWLTCLAYAGAGALAMALVLAWGMHRSPRPPDDPRARAPRSARGARLTPEGAGRIAL